MGIVIYTDWGIKSWAAGCARGPLIFIRPKYRGDKGLLAHEKVHVRQWFASLMLHPFLYLLSSRYRLWAEVRAYRAQLQHYPDDRSARFAEFIALHYRLDISAEQARQLLTQP